MNHWDEEPEPELSFGDKGCMILIFSFLSSLAIIGLYTVLTWIF